MSTNPSKKSFHIYISSCPKILPNQTLSKKKPAFFRDGHCRGLDPMGIACLHHRHRPLRRGVQQPHCAVGAAHRHPALPTLLGGKRWFRSPFGGRSVEVSGFFFVWGVGGLALVWVLRLWVLEAKCCEVLDSEEGRARPHLGHIEATVLPH